MKYLKMLGLAAVAAAALMAFIGTGTASATVLCTETPAEKTDCAKAEPVGTEITAKLESETATLVTSFATITCKKSVVGGKITNAGSTTSTVKGSIEELTFEECGTSTVDVLAKGTLELHWIPGTHNGTLTGSGQEITTVTPTIFGNVHCIYRTENTDLGTFTEGKPATIDAEQSQIPRLPTNGLCDEKAEWNAKYILTKPTETLGVENG